MANKSWKRVNISFSNKEKEEIRKIEASPQEYADAVQTLAFAGYKVGVSFDSSVDCYALALTGKEKTGKDENVTFMAFYSKFEIFMSITVYLMRKGKEAPNFSILYDASADNSW